jgi:glyoxylase-like metal-dependent hydrolase (beta-lactamase superfamily II)
MPRLNLRLLAPFGLAASVLLAAALARGETVGDALAPWSRGALDIHHINTGRGNATLFVLPDGTTLLVDAGDGGALPPRGTPPRPDASRPPAEWIARYVRAMGVSAIDYGYVTHFHADHMGAMAELAKRIPVRVVVDRGWPDYAFPAADHAEFKTPECPATRAPAIRIGRTSRRRWGAPPGRSISRCSTTTATATPRTPSSWAP